MSELLDIYDDSMEKIGVKDRTQVHLDGDWHRGFHCWIAYRDTTGTGRMVVQRRGAAKSLFPNALDITAAGHYEAGESIEAGIRELKEELGIDVPCEQLVPLGVRFDVMRVGRIINRELDHVFLLLDDRDILEYTLHPREVAGLVEFRIADALDMFSGHRDTIIARATQHRGTPHRIVDIDVRATDFIPRTDAYVYKILILAQRCLNGERHLVI